MEVGKTCEREHDFTLVLNGVDHLDEDVADALFGAGCDDATPSLRFGKVYLTFTRTARSLREAILTAIRDVRRARIGADVLRVDECDLVTQAEIGRRVGRSRQVINQYISGKRGPGGFPPPTCEITDGTSLWLWSEVAYWLRQNDMIKEQDLVDARDRDAINAILDYQRQMQLEPAAFEELSESLRPLTDHLDPISLPHVGPPGG